MPIPVVSADLEVKIPPADLTRYSRGSAANITEAIAQAWDGMRSAGLNYYTAASWDALTAMTIPPVLKRYVVEDAINILSSGMLRPAYIDTMAVESSKFRSFIATDNIRSLDTALTRKDAATQEGIDVTYRAPVRKFDRTEADYWTGLARE